MYGGTDIDKWCGPDEVMSVSASRSISRGVFDAKALGADDEEQPASSRLTSFDVTELGKEKHDYFCCCSGSSGSVTMSFQGAIFIWRVQLWEEERLSHFLCTLYRNISSGVRVQLH